VLHDIIMTSYCCQRYAECLVTTLFQQDSAPAHCAAHVQQLDCCVQKRRTFLCPTCGLQTAQISVLWITRSGLSRNIVSTTDKSIVWMNWNGGSSMSGAALNSRFLTTLQYTNKPIDQWRGRHLACVHAKGGHFEYNFWIDNADFVHICYIQCDLFDCHIFNYEILPATLANTFLFILQGSGLAKFQVWW